MVVGGKVAVIGATGYLGGKVAAVLRARRRPVRALVQHGTNADALRALGVEIVRVDVHDRTSLDPLLDGMTTLVCTAFGHSQHRPSDSPEQDDDSGYRSLVDAARNTGLSRFVFTSVFSCDEAHDAPQFRRKKLAEDYLESSGVPFVSLRPGFFFDNYFNSWVKTLQEGRLGAVGDPTVRWTHILADDVARCLALAVDEPRALGRRIDLGCDRPVSANDLAEAFSAFGGSEIRVDTVPWWLFGLAARFHALANPTVLDFREIFKHLLTGLCVADTSVQADLFGPVPTVEDSLSRWLAPALALAASQRTRPRRSSGFLDKETVGTPLTSGRRECP